MFMYKKYLLPLTFIAILKKIIIVMKCNKIKHSVFLKIMITHVDLDFISSILNKNKEVY